MSAPSAPGEGEEAEAGPSLEALVERLADEGFAMADGIVPADLASALSAELHGHIAAGRLAVAGVGRDEAFRRDGEIRRAAILWLDGSSEAQQKLLALAEALRLLINRRLFLGLFDFECNYIAYPVGGFYGRHLDRLQGAKNRVVSFVTYLDADWGEADGGALRLWRSPDDHGEPAATVLPKAGRVVLMLSEEIPHEVLPAHRPRHAIAGWWRINGA